MNIVKVLIVVSVIALVGYDCSALTKNQVLVVANSADKESLKLAEFYIKARGIPKTNLVVLKTGTGYVISRANYKHQIVAPLRRALGRHGLGDRIKCICLMRGIPLRVGGDTKDSSPGSIRSAYLSAQRDAHRKLAAAYILLNSVGKKFPAPRTDKLNPVEKLFGPSTAKSAAKLLKPKELLRNIYMKLARLRIDISNISDPARQKIASRQLMAMQLHIRGLKGLIRYIASAKPAGAPDPKTLKRRLVEAERKLDSLQSQKIGAANIKAKLEMMRRINGLSVVCLYARDSAKHMTAPLDSAAIDSELVLLKVRNYPTNKWLANPMHWKFRRNILRRRQKLPPTLMVSRIDGPTFGDAKRMIENALTVEKKGLRGVFYIDAGAPKRLQKTNYDLHLKRLCSFLKANTKLKVVMDDKPTLFTRGSCPDAALYIGWYSLRYYIPAFVWKKGAVGWHIASFEAADLRNASSNQWCVKMIQGGVAGTVGPVNEPFLHSFPLPEEFFPLLLTGKWTLAECYWRTTTMISWRMILLGDPLYNPFAANPQVATEKLPSGLAPRTLNRHR